MIYYMIGFFTIPAVILFIVFMELLALALYDSIEKLYKKIHKGRTKVRLIQLRKRHYNLKYKNPFGIYIYFKRANRELETMNSIEDAIKKFNYQKGYRIQIEDFEVILED